MLRLSTPSSPPVSASVLPIAKVIAKLALREATLLDDLWNVRTDNRSEPLRRRRHKQFVASLAAYYCCICESFLERANPEPVDTFMSSVREYVARFCVVDQFYAGGFGYIGQLPEKRQACYKSAIDRGREIWSEYPFYAGDTCLTFTTSRDIARLMFNDDPNEVEWHDLAFTIGLRLDWTANELTG